MPKYITYNSEFTPISFTDRIAPLQLYKAEYDKQQEAYYKLLESSKDLADLANSPIDSDSYQVYQDFNKDIESIGDTLGRYGLTPDLRQRFLDLRKRQITEINPLIEKQKKRAELVKEQRTYRQSHQNSFFDKDYSVTPISGITNNSTWRGYDVDKIVKDVSDSVLSNMMTNNGVDTTDYDEIKNKYNYDKLDDKQKEALDNAISLSKSVAGSAYKQYNDTYDINMVKARKARSGSSGSSGGGSSSGSLNGALVTLPTGDAIKLSQNKLGQVSVTDITGKTREVSGTSYADIYKAFYGGHDFAGFRDVGEKKIPILVDYEYDDKGKVAVNEDGTKKVKKYYTISTDKNGKSQITPINSTDEESLLSVLGVSYSNGVESREVDRTSDNFINVDGNKLSSMSDISKLSDKQKMSLASNLQIVEQGESDIAKINKAFEEMFSFGYHVEIKTIKELDRNGKNGKQRFFIKKNPKNTEQQNSSEAKSNNAGGTVFATK